MSDKMREQIEELVDAAWDLHDMSQSSEEKHQLTLDVMELLSQLPENVEILKIMQ